MTRLRSVQTLLQYTVLLSLGALAAEWSYSGSLGPSHWADVAPACGQSQQSPINIFEGDVQANKVTQEFVFKNYNTRQNLQLTIKNNGHSAVVNIGGTSNVSISGGGLPPYEFKALQFHFHWGSNSESGSEHFISSRAYPMEAHIVHYNTKYASLDEAINKPDGLAVLGFMYEISDQDNTNYANLVYNLSSISRTGEEVGVEPVALNSLLPTTFRQFYRYNGSLTTPSCQESVTWTVFKEPIPISERQLQAFRTLLGSDRKSLTNNYRPVQELNDRQVLASFNPDIHWGYSEGHVDVNHWPHFYSNCASDRQSPIDLPSSDSHLDPTLSSFKFLNYNTTAIAGWILKNNGHTAQVDITVDDILISEAGLPDTYQAAQLHLHWGDKDDRGSEHTVDSQAYPVELHIVHFKKSLGSLQNAVAVPQGLAVLGVFFKVTPEDNPHLAIIIDHLDKINHPGTNVTISSFALQQLLPTDTHTFYRYNGSLTTPKCYQTVIWTVFRDTVSISESQLAALRQLVSSEKDDDGNQLLLVNNFRPVQPLNDRLVTRNFVAAVKPHWSYHGEHGAEDWYKDYPVCEDRPGSRQSPINIEPRRVQYRELSEFTWTNYRTTDIELRLRNNGHSVQVDILGGDVTISNGGLQGTYKAAQLHFHWGSDSKHGSEHLIDNTAYPMEVHIVHYNVKYGSLLAASAQSDGLAVLGFMYEVSDKDNFQYNVITDRLDKTTSPDSKLNLPAVPLASLLPSNLGHFYRYLGSLTTPACNESVIWSVFRDTIKISEKQLSKFRSLDSSDVNPTTKKHIPLVDNYRPVQSLNGRVVQANFLIGAGVVPKADFSLFLLVLTTALVVLRPWTSR